MHPLGVRPTVKFGGGSLMVWGSITPKGVGPLVRIEGTMNKEYYLKILQENLPTAMDLMGENVVDIIFQHDNDPKHTAKVVSEWLQTQRFSVLDWPPQSPDLNPIENLWSYLKQQLAKYATPPQGMNELWKRVQEEWYAIPTETLKKLYESVPKRIQEVKRAKGLWTSY